MVMFPYKRASSLDTAGQFETTYEKLCGARRAELEEEEKRNSTRNFQFKSRRPASASDHVRISRKVGRDSLQKDLRFLADPFAREKGPKSKDGFSFFGGRGLGIVCGFLNFYEWKGVREDI